MKAIVLLINQDLAADPKIKEMLAADGVRSPITVEHSPFQCQRCQADCWIGPKQKIYVTLHGHEAVCYRCLFEDEELLASGVLPMVSLNPEIENAPRRVT